MKILLIVYDNGSFLHSFPLGIAYLAGVLRRDHRVTIYQQDVHHYPEEHLTRFLDQNDFDLVGLGVIAGYYQYEKLLKISRAVNASSRRPKYYVLGGHGPTPEPEYFLDKTGADIVVMGEGETVMIELLKALESGKGLGSVPGIAYKDQGRMKINPRPPLIDDLNTIPWPAYDMFPMEYYRLMRPPHATNDDFTMTVLSGRGCPFQCNFCYRMDEGYRAREIGAILEEVRYLQMDYGINYIDFADELLMVSKTRIFEICEAILTSGLSFKWYCNGRLNYATPEILAKMKQAGCVFINYGIEAFDDQVLRNMNKALTTRQIEKGIQATLASGISPGFNIIFGNIGDTKETLRKGVEFLLKYDDGAELRTIRPVTPYPGCPLYYEAIERGLLKGVADFYENKHKNSDLLAVNFTDLTDEEFHRSLMEANMSLIENYYRKKQAAMTDLTRDLYLNLNTAFRGYRHT